MLYVVCIHYIVYTYCLCVCAVSNVVFVRMRSVCDVYCEVCVVERGHTVYVVCVMKFSSEVRLIKS